jgi:NAD+ kinase
VTPPNGAAPHPRVVGILRHRLVGADNPCVIAAREVLGNAGVETWEVERDVGERRNASRLRSTDLLLTVGGDGTLLFGAKLAAPRSIPLLGVNLGRLGFLTELEAGQIEYGLDRFLAGDYWLDERTLIEVSVRRDGRRAVRDIGLNEAVIGGGTGDLLRLRAMVDGQEVGTFDADGVIVATATGSTAYSLAAGGPVLEPSVAGLVLVPLNPFALTVRPIVFPPKQDLNIELTRNGGALTVDGGRSRRLREGDRVRIAAHQRPLQLIRFTERERFYGLLREKLGWGLPLVPTVQRA